jgi:hypothetical protein
VTGAELIAQERQRQIDAEGWTPEHDDHHCDGELIDAAMVYANDRASSLGWPWVELPHSLRADRVRDLTKAGALIAAEIDRLGRRSAESQS